MSTLSKFSKKGSARTHVEARAVICCVCGKKVKDKKGGVGFVNDRLSNLVRQYVHQDYSVQNISHPTAMCGSCRVTLGSYEKVIPKIMKFLYYEYIYISESSQLKTQTTPIAEL